MIIKIVKRGGKLLTWNASITAELSSVLWYTLLKCKMCNFLDHKYLSKMTISLIIISSLMHLSHFNSIKPNLFSTQKHCQLCKISYEPMKCVI